MLVLEKSNLIGGYSCSLGIDICNTRRRRFLSIGDIFNSSLIPARTLAHCRSWAFPILTYYSENRAVVFENLLSLRISFLQCRAVYLGGGPRGAPGPGAPAGGGALFSRPFIMRASSGDQACTEVL